MTLTEPRARLLRIGKLQRATLELLQDGPRSAYSMGCGMSVLNRLSNKALVMPVGHGHIAQPGTALWKITPAGRAALAAHDREAGNE